MILRRKIIEIVYKFEWMCLISFVCIFCFRLLIMVGLFSCRFVLGILKMIFIRLDYLMLFYFFIGFEFWL